MDGAAERMAWGRRSYSSNNPCAESDQPGESQKDCGVLDPLVGAGRHRKATDQPVLASNTTTVGGAVADVRERPTRGIGEKRSIGGGHEGIICPRI